jgi:hypothetical protein
MVTIVVVINLVIAALCFYAAWHLWRLRKALASAADALVVADKATHAVLSNAPQNIIRGQLGSYQLRQKYRQLDQKLQQVEKLLGLIGFGQIIWRRYRPLKGQPMAQQRSNVSKRARMRKLPLVSR